MSFNLEDKVRWDELSPSLQDELKSLYNRYHAMYGVFENTNNTIRITVGKNPPKFAIKYNELWFDTKYMVLRCLTDDGWILTRAYWYDKKAETVLDDVDAPRSRNPRTTCHCYNLTWEDKFNNLCHCHNVVYKAPIVGNDEKSLVSFIMKTTASTYSTKYRFILTPTGGTVHVLTLNAINADNETVAAIYPTQKSVSDMGEESVIGYFNYVPEQYNFIFDNSDVSGCDIAGNTIIPVTFTKKVKLIKVYCQIASGSSGLIVQLDEFVGGTYITVFKTSLNGDYTPYTGGWTCYSSKHGKWLGRHW